MDIEFTKMNGAGNDFVLLDNRRGKLSLSGEQIAWICDRHRGVGADGLLLVEPAAGDEKADFRMRYYNADGGEAEMCGNGARCFARYVQRLGWDRDALSFATPAGVIRAEFLDKLVTIELSPPRDTSLNRKIRLDGGEQTIHSIDTGVPHAVLFVSDADQAMVQAWGSEIRHHSVFAPRGTNVNFVEIKEKDLIRVRTYERGVENETLACGTGVVASAILSHLIQALNVPIRVLVQGGDVLEVNFVIRDGAPAKVRLTGPADFVFDGKFTLPKAAALR